MSLTSDVATLTGIANREGFDQVFSYQLRCIARPEDVALGISEDGRCRNVVEGLRQARELGLLTVALVGGGGGQIAQRAAADHVLLAASPDPLVVKELHVTLYHVLWELVRVFFEHPGVLQP